jgi:hypothetical protein
VSLIHRRTKRGWGEARRRVIAAPIVALSLCGLCIHAGCSEEYRDVSKQKPYVDMIGRTYRIAGDVGAFGIYVSGGDNVPTFVALYPQSEAPSGPEVTLSRSVERGRTFRIVSATLFDTPIDDTLFYTVELEGEPIAAGVPVHVRLRRNNSVRDSAELNPQYYERVH